MLQVQSCYFAHETYCFVVVVFFFYFFVADASLDLKVPGKDVQESDQYIYLVVRTLCTRKHLVCFEKND